MLAVIAMTPSAPVLVPELAGSAAAEVAEIREAAQTAAAALPGRWIAVGVGAAERVIDPDARGTFAGYGADVEIALGPRASAGMAALPLCALWAGWLRGQVNPDAQVEVRVFDRDCDPGTAIDLGGALRAEVDALPEPIGVLVVADGATTLTESAPGGFDPGSQQVQESLDHALAVADTAALALLPATIVGRAAYQVLAGMAGGLSWSPRQLYCGAPYGVGYSIGVWRRSPDSR